MKYILTAALLIPSFFCYSQLQTNVKWSQLRSQETKDTIYYNPSNKLDWDDFKGKADAKSVALAITSSGFGFTAGIQYRNGKGTLTINVYCYFSKYNSWVKEDKASDYALNHEQHHFDVSYIATCRFFEKLKAAKFTLANYDDLLNAIYNESTADLEKLQNEYDGQTRNGQLKNIQAEWNTKIEKMLAQTAFIN
jgi:hypothetical protein